MLNKTVSQIRDAVRADESLTDEQREDMLIELNTLPDEQMVSDVRELDERCYFNKLPGAGAVIGNLAG